MPVSVCDSAPASSSLTVTKTQCSSLQVKFVFMLKLGKSLKRTFYYRYFWHESGADGRWSEFNALFTVRLRCWRHCDAIHCELNLEKHADAAKNDSKAQQLPRGVTW